MAKCTINDAVFLLPLQFSLNGCCYEFLCIQSHQILLALSHRNIFEKKEERSDVNKKNNN